MAYVRAPSFSDITNSKKDCNDVCSLCPLHTSAYRVRGEIHPKVEGRTSILIVGEAPGIAERGKPFDGQAGQITRVLLDKTGLGEYCSFTNVAKCRPYNMIESKWGMKQIGRPPNQLEMLACRPLLQRELDICKPDFIILLGNPPLQSLFDDKKMTITRVRGEVLSWRGIPTMPIIQPASILHNGSQSLVNQIVSDLRKAKQHIFEGGVRDRLADVKWSYIRNRDELGQIMRRSRDQKISIDTETNTLDFWQEDARILCAGIAFDKNECFVLPMDHKDSPMVTDVPWMEFMVALYKMVMMSPRVTYHNLQFDATFMREQFMRHLNKLYIEFKNAHCSLIQHYLLDPNGSHKLEDLAESIGYPNYKDGPKKYLKSLPAKMRNWGNIPLSVLGPYNAYDTCSAYEIEDNFSKEIYGNEFHSNAYTNVLSEATREVAMMEHKGVAMDMKRNEDLLESYKKTVDAIGSEIYNNPLVLQTLIRNGKVPIFRMEDVRQENGFLREKPVSYGKVKIEAALSLTSPDQLSKFFYDDLGLSTDGVSKGKKGHSTAREYLDMFDSQFRALAMKLGRFRRVTVGKDEVAEFPSELVFKGWKVALKVPELERKLWEAELSGDQNAIRSAESTLQRARELKLLFALHVPHTMVSFRDRDKLYTTYIRPVAKWVDPRTGIYHYDLHVNGTITGRLTSGIHTIVKQEDIQSQFISKLGRERGLILAADYSAIEVRVMASFSGDEKLIQIFKDGIDIHRQVAAFAFRKNIEDVTSMERRYSKTVHFGILYLESDDSLAGRLRGPGETVEDCLVRVVTFKNGYFETFSGVKRHIDRMQSDLAKKGVAHVIAERQELAEFVYNQKRGLNRYLISAFDRMLPVEPDTSNWDMKVRPVNWPIQSTATDMTTTAAIRINRRFRANGMYSHIVFLIHDAIYVDTCPEEVDKAIEIMKEEMEQNVPAWMKCPVKADFEVGPSWGEQKPLEDKKMAKGDRHAASMIRN